MNKRSAMCCATFLGSLLIAGCSTTAVHMYDGPERPIEQLAVVKSWNPRVNIVAIDGKSLGINLGRADRLYVLPGEHTIALHSAIDATWRPGYSSSTTAKGELQLRTEAGHAYVIRAKVDDDRVYYSAADKGTHYNEQCYNPRLPPQTHVQLECY